MNDQSVRLYPRMHHSVGYYIPECIIQWGIISQNASVSAVLYPRIYHSVRYYIPEYISQWGIISQNSSFHGVVIISQNSSFHGVIIISQNSSFHGYYVPQFIIPWFELRQEKYRHMWNEIYSCTVSIFLIES